MGIHSVDKCIFTGLPVTHYNSGTDAIEYHVQIGNKQHLIRLHWDAPLRFKENSFFQKNKNIFQSLLINNKWFKNELNFIDIPQLEELLKKSDFPKSHQQKLENLFLALINLQKEDGEEINIGDILWGQDKWKLLYFRSASECNFYINHLESEDLIKLSKTGYAGVGLAAQRLSITYKGLGYSIKLQEEGDKSKKCFVAMSFNPSVSDIREAIKKAIIETGYEVILIDEQNINSDKTINDEIIANLKRCKFCIADFSLHSNGVYFESGFALGQGKKVIYTCRRDEFSNAHFDIKPLQHIIYDTPEQLTKDLINKIRAFID